MSAPMAVMWFAPRKAAAGERGAMAAVAVMTHPALIYRSACHAYLEVYFGQLYFGHERFAK